MNNPGAWEFCRPHLATKLPANGRLFSAVASADECEALARRLGVLAIGALRVDGLLRPRSKGKMVVLTASLVAEVTQACVVTLDPVDSRIDVTFERVFEFGIEDDWARFGDPGRDLELDEMEIDATDPIVDDCIDVGEAAAEQLALELDPFPRASGATFDPLPRAADADDAGDRHPFAALNRLRKQE